LSRRRECIQGEYVPYGNICFVVSDMGNGDRTMTIDEVLFESLREHWQS
jgi:hypothetical protein